MVLSSGVPKVYAQRTQFEILLSQSGMAPMLTRLFSKSR
jgi:hypothetical protein